MTRGSFRSLSEADGSGKPSARGSLYHLPAMPSWLRAPAHVNRVLWAVVVDAIEGDTLDEPDKQRIGAESGNMKVNCGAAAWADRVPMLVQLERGVLVQVGCDAPADTPAERLAGEAIGELYGPVEAIGNRVEYLLREARQHAPALQFPRLGNSLPSRSEALRSRAAYDEIPPSETPAAGKGQVGWLLPELAPRHGEQFLTGHM
jgi:hypothetical protein